MLEEVYGEILSHRAALVQRRWPSRSAASSRTARSAAAAARRSFASARTSRRRRSSSCWRTPSPRRRSCSTPASSTSSSTPGAASAITQPAAAGSCRACSIESRIDRLFDAEVLLGDKAYTPVELVDDLQAGIFSELKAAEPRIDPIRRALQRQLHRHPEERVHAAGVEVGGPVFPGRRRGGISFGGGQPRTSELRGVARVALAKLEKTDRRGQGQGKGCRHGRPPRRPAEPRSRRSCPKRRSDWVP